MDRRYGLRSTPRWRYAPISLSHSWETECWAGPRPFACAWQGARNGGLVSPDTGPRAPRLLVGADGLHSRVAVAAGLRDRTGRGGRYALGIYVRGLPAHEGFGEMHLGREVYCGVSVFADGQANVTMVMPKAAIRARRDGARHGLAPGTLDQVPASFPRLYPRVPPSVPSREMRAVGPLRPTS